MKEDNNKQKSLLIVIGLIALIGILGGATFAFFNYTRTGASNILSVGRINFISK